VSEASAALPLTIGVATVASASSDQGSASADRLVELLTADGHTAQRLSLNRERDVEPPNRERITMHESAVGKSGMPQRGRYESALMEVIPDEDEAYI
jgi:hypothetical protein